jgi:hypothetical protein
MKKFKIEWILALVKFNHDSNYLGDEFISFWQVIIA